MLEAGTILMVDVRFSAEAACSVLATDDLDSDTSLRLGVELLLLRLVNTVTYKQRMTKSAQHVLEKEATSQPENKS